MTAEELKLLESGRVMDVSPPSLHSEPFPIPVAIQSQALQQQIPSFKSLAFT